MRGLPLSILLVPELYTTSSNANIDVYIIDLHTRPVKACSSRLEPSAECWMLLWLKTIADF